MSVVMDAAAVGLAYPLPVKLNVSVFDYRRNAVRLNFHFLAYGITEEAADWKTSYLALSIDRPNVFT